MLESLFTTDNQNRGTPTLSGVGENRVSSALSGVLDLFGQASTVVASAKNTINTWDGKATAGDTTSEPGKAATAKTFFASYGVWIGLGVALLAAVFFLRK